MLNYQRYKRVPVVDFPERTWPNKEIMKAPIWCSVDLRDGNQALVEPMVVEEKVEMFNLLVKLGFKEIEVGFPAASQIEYDFLRTLVERKLIPDDVEVQVLVQCREHLIKRTFEALEGVKKAIVHIYNSTSTLQRDVVFHKDREDIKDIAVIGTKMVQRYMADCDTQIRLEYSPESFTGTELDFALDICTAVQETWGATRENPIIINLPSTVEMTTPNVYADQIEWMNTHFKNRESIILSIHPHNDRGEGVASTELALLAGADRVEGTLFGNGERTGNVDILTVAYNMFSQGINPELEIDYIVAPPRMALYLEYSTRIYSIYLKYIAPEDIFPYSIDEVFMDVTNYLHTYNMTARELAMTMIQDVLKTTGITATAGIGTNMYLCKIAMDIVAKHIKADKDGVRIAELDEMSYRRKLWSHRPLTDFWRVGKGYAKKLEEYGLYTMGDIARCSIGKENELYNEELLYKLFGVNAELLIDHAWGYEPCTMEMVKAYKPETNSVCSGQVLHCPYDFEKAKLVVKEMTDQMVLDLVDKKLVTDQIVLTVGYDIENLNNPDRRKKYHGETTIDRYGRRTPKHAHGTTNLKWQTSSTKLITDAVIELYDRIVDRNLLIRRINITANRLVDESSVKKEEVYKQLDLFTDYEAQRKKQEEEEVALDREKRMQEAMLSIKKKFGKNAVLKGMNLQEGATARDRNEQIGGHKA